MQVREIAGAEGREVETARPDVTVDTACHVMRARNIGAVVVSADGRRVDGLLTERDVVAALVRHGPAALERPVADVMQRRPATCRPNQRVTEVMHTMTDRRTRHIVVVDDDGIAGIVSIGDVVKHRIADLELEVAMMRTRQAATR